MTSYTTIHSSSMYSIRWISCPINSCKLCGRSRTKYFRLKSGQGFVLINWTRSLSAARSSPESSTNSARSLPLHTQSKLISCTKLPKLVHQLGCRDKRLAMSTSFQRDSEPPEERRVPTGALTVQLSGIVLIGIALLLHDIPRVTIPRLGTHFTRWHRTKCSIPHALCRWSTPVKNSIHSVHEPQPLRAATARDTYVRVNLLQPDHGDRARVGARAAGLLHGPAYGDRTPVPTPLRVAAHRHSIPAAAACPGAPAYAS